MKTSHRFIRLSTTPKCKIQQHNMMSGFCKGHSASGSCWKK